jgi:hypothetical protein
MLPLIVYQSVRVRRRHEVRDASPGHARIDVRELSQFADVRSGLRHRRNADAKGRAEQI